MEPHVCLVANRSSDRRGEYVEVANGAKVPVALTGLELTDYTTGQRNAHVYRFRASSDGGTLTLSAGSVAYVFSGHGTNELLADGSLLLFAKRSAQSGTTTATSLTCGAPMALSSTRGRWRS